MSEEINGYEEDKENIENHNDSNESTETITRVTGMYKEWFLDYASYVILERAVPGINDGFKPVQRRIMHSMKDLDDGRYNKVANIVGHTMQYHPHGDASIADAMVQLGQKELLIDMQGNWGNILTGDRAAASRYIEARLSKFALDVVFNPKTTEWQASYDGRKKEPVNLPVKFPLLLAQGAEGIAVGLSTKILPHNFIELIEASIKYLKGRSFKILPDFLTGGIADFSNYNDGKRGGKVRVRAKISQLDKKTLVITEIPFAKPKFIGVSEMLKSSTDYTVHLLKRELEIQLHELEEQWHFASLERIFIENRIYRDIEEEETWQGVIKAIDLGLKPHIKHLKRAITEEDIVRLTEIRIKKISKFDIDKAKQFIESLEEKIAQVKEYLNNLIGYAIDYFKRLKTTYGKDKGRKTEIRSFEDIIATKVVIRNTKLFVNREEGFVGTSLRKNEYVTDCSDIDDIIVFKKDGKMIVTKVASKTFVGKDIIHLAVFKKKDTRTVYNMMYRDGKGGASYMKRFSVTGVTRDKDYDLTPGKSNTIVHYFSANPNGEAEVVTVLLRAVGSIKKLKWDIDFADLAVKGRGVRGNTITKFAIRKVEFKSSGVSTLKPRKIWFDDAVQRLNVDARGELLGEFRAEDKILIATQSGKIKAVTPDLQMHFEDDMIVLEKWIPKKPISVIYFDGEKERYYVKRFLIETEEKEEIFISEHSKSQLEIIAVDYRPMAEVVFSKRSLDKKEINFEEFIAVKGIKAQGNQLTTDKIKQVNLLASLPYEEPEEQVVEEVEVVEEEVISTSEESPASAAINKNTSKEENNTSDDGQITLF